MNKTTLILLILILALGGFFRFYRISETPPGLYPDEAMNGNNALEAIATSNFSAEGGPAYGWKIFYPENNGREGLFINIQAISIKVFGNEPWALRIVSAIFGTLTILGVYLAAKELFSKNFQFPIFNFQSDPNDLNSKRFRNSHGNAIALLSSFFIAVSYWHINFSRIGFRAITVPFLTVFAAYFLLKGLRTGKITSLVAAGIFTGLGLHTYIAFRFVPFILIIPIIWYIWDWHKGTKDAKCAPCAVALFIFAAFVAALPIGYYFLQNPQDFFGRGGQVSVFATESPIYEFAKSNLLTLQMFFYRGDCNWRHNYNCQPQLHPLAALFFAAGLITILWKFKNSGATGPDSGNSGTGKLSAITLLAWLAFMSLPATLTHEGIPHALRTIGMIPPVMILAGLGAYQIYALAVRWLEGHKIKFPEISGKIGRIQSEVAVIGILALLWIPTMTWRNYFINWAEHEETYFSFATDILHLGKYLNSLPTDVEKYVVVNMSGVEVRGIPMPAETVMFATDTFTDAGRRAKNLNYILPENIKNISPAKNKKAVIAPLNGNDDATRSEINKYFPEFSENTPEDFIIYSNLEK